MPTSADNRHLEHRLRQFSVVCGGMVAAIGGYFFAAWLSGAMTWLGHQVITMRTNASLCILLCGLSLLLITLPWRGTAARGLARIFAAVSLIIGGLTLLEIIFGFDFGIDQLLVVEPPGAIGALHPNRMALPGAISFTTSGLSLLFLLRGSYRCVRIGQFLAALLAVIALLGMLEYLFGAEMLYGKGRYTIIAWQATVANFILAMGILAARPAEGLMAPVIAANPGGAAIRRMIPYALILPVLLGWLRLQGEWYGLYERYFGTSILVLGLSVSLVVLIYHTGIGLGRSAEALQRTQSLLLEAEALSHTGAWEWDLSLDIWTFSEEWQHVHGIEHQTLSPEDLLAIAHPADRETVRQAFTDLSRGVRAYDLEHRIVRQDTGEVRMVRARGQFVKDRSGRVIRAHGFVQDITDQKQAEEVAQIQRQVLEAVVENLPAGVMLAEGEDYRIVLANPAYRSLAPGKEMLGKSIREVWPEIPADFWEIFSEVIATGTSYEAMDAPFDIARAPGGMLERRYFSFSCFRVRLTETRQWGIMNVAWETTDRKRSEEALRTSEGLLSKVLETLPVGVWILDRQGKVLRINDAAKRIWGLGTTPIEEKAPDDYRGWWLDTGARINHDQWGGVRAVTKGEASEEEVEIETFDRRRKIIINASVPLRDEAKSIVGAITVNQDITARKHAEMELRESERRYSALFNNKTIGIAHCRTITDPSGTPIDFQIISVNEAYERITGIRKGEIEGRLAREIFPGIENFSFDYIGNYGRVALEGGELDFETFFETLQQWFSIYVYRFRPGEFTAIFTDITARKWAEASLRESEAKFRALFERAGIGMGRVSFSDARWIDVNEAFCSMLGYTPEFMLATPWHKITHPDDIDLDLLPFQRMAAGGLESYTVEKRFIHYQGQYVWARLNLSLVRDRDGMPEYEIAVIEDITDRKLAEQELHRAKDELEARVHERTRELSSALEELRRESVERFQAVEELRRNEQLLLQQSRLAAMGEMLGNISHQWRQPLNVLGLILQEMQRRYAKGNFSREFLDSSVVRCSQLITHMSQTIDDFRSFLTPQRTRLPFDMREAVETAVSMTRESLRGININLSAEDAMPVHGFRNEFAQVVINILMNARDVFRERNIAEPRITLKAFRQNNRNILLIADNGGGIPEKILDKIFEPYFTTKPPDKGTGIGLFMAKTIIEKNMGGRLTVRNTDEGAEFRIEIGQ